ncbi:lipopolysaccharide assembly protein LapB [Bacteroides sp. 224]|uniref:tetratricopeptide repeat protein n=1 Tax=Bacteroides sp. 224 TaxID=2302936 RepID=UPI0013D4C7FC|nr:hypothetical protein [Bacteroides sp. 224]NDV65575.1 hypothetical protein [Bacteroides sp. 224]
MKMKMFVVTLLLSAGVMTAFAQDDDQCKTNSSISHEAVRAGNFKDAYTPWKAVLKDCPTLRYYTYTDGFAILKALLKELKKDSPEYKAYFEELMAVHDQLIQYQPEFAKTLRGVASQARLTSNKGMDYMNLAPEVDANFIYDLFKKSVTEEKEKASAAALFYLMQTSYNKLQADENHKEEFIQDYLNITEWTDQALAAAEKETQKTAYERVKGNLDALFVNSGAADCASLQGIYGPKVESNKTDLVYLKKVIIIMKNMKCTESEAYFQASTYVHAIEPSAESAAGCAAMAYKKGDLDTAVKFFDQAVSLETDEAKKADMAYRAAAILYTAKKFGQSRTYAQKALNANPNLGGAYILIATLYASSPKWSDEPVLNKCTYYLIIDKLQKAKAVDPSLTDEANKLINSYSAHLPAASDLFMLGYKAGDTITIGGWIGESTRIR